MPVPGVADDRDQAVVLWGNHKDEVQFNLDFEKAFDGAGLKVNSAEIKYFNKNYVAIQFLYDFIWYGSGYIDILIDLQDKKHPTARR
ncbi:hypothetical protein DT075_03330 [Bacillus licheniformis]|nr:hypothetical protein DT075_03330 [Bacillus licheniformis]